MADPATATAGRGADETAGDTCVDRGAPHDRPVDRAADHGSDQVAEIVAEIVAAVAARPGPHGVRVVGIDGPAGSGKTTLGAALARALSASVVHIDDFLAWTDLLTWWPRFDAEVLTPLAHGRDVRYQVRDWIHDEFGGSVRRWKNTAATPVVIVEGVTTTRRAAADRLAYAVWVEAAPAQRLERGLARDGESHRELWRQWQIMEAAFFAADGTRARADLRIDTSGPDSGSL